MWASFKDYWADFKAGRDGARYFAAFCLLLTWLIYMAFAQ